MESHISLFKPSHTPYYYIQFTDERGRRRQRSTHCKNKKDALQSLADLKNIIKEKQKPMLFSRFTEEFKILIQGSLNVKTIDMYSYTFTMFLRIVGDITLNKITAMQWDMFKSGRLKEVKSVRCNMELKMLRAALFTAVRWRMLDINPFSRQPLCKIPDTDSQYLTVEQFRCVVGAMINVDAREIVTIAFFTGMRLGEIMSLKWQNIDLKAGIIYVKNSANFKTKTGKQRAVPMNKEAAALLSLRNERRTNEKDEVFPDIRGEFASKLFKKAAQLLLGKNTRIHFHSLRHSFCSNLIQAGANIRIVQMLAGHSSITTTEKYLHHITSDARNAVELLSMN